MLTLLKNKKLLFGMIALVVVTATISVLVTGLVLYNWNGFQPRNEITFDPNKVSTQNIDKFNQVRKILENKYYKGIDENSMLEGAIGGMAQSLNDPYTAYYTKEQMQMLTEDINGSYVGIGISIDLDKDGLVTVIEPFEGSPAQKAGVKQGDKITKVNGKDVTGLKDSNTVVKLIKGTEGTSVKVTFYRPSEGKSFDLDIVRKKIKVENLKSEMLPGDIGYIQIKTFDAEINNYFQNSLNSLIKQGMKGLIIDLRDDPGGYYDQVVAIADRLLPKGVIVYTEDKNKKREYENSDARELGMPIAVLVNGNSASASEILSGAIKDFKKGTLIGTKTFGKGLVQQEYTLGDGSGVKVTIARYFTPSGVCIQGIGIQPNIEVKLPDKYKNIPVSQVQRSDDTQLQKAIDVIQGQIK
ncbi:MAG: S41 family peptidase [Bacillota bacterium]|nr:S41 family peptidase [Bacillota bacterium]